MFVLLQLGFVVVCGESEKTRKSLYTVMSRNAKSGMLNSDR